MMIRAASVSGLALPAPTAGLAPGWMLLAKLQRARLQGFEFRV